MLIQDDKNNVNTSVTAQRSTGRLEIKNPLVRPWINESLVYNQLLMPWLRTVMGSERLEIDTFSVVKTDDGCQVVIGYSSTNTNRVNIPVESTSCDVDTPITFNANLFKEVLVANRECSSAILEVSTEGLAKVNFKIDDYDSTYFIVAMQDVD